MQGNASLDGIPTRIIIIIIIDHHAFIHRPVSRKDISSILMGFGLQVKHAHI